MSVSKSFAVPSLLMADSSSSEGEEAQSFSQEEYESEDVMDETVYKPPLNEDDEEQGGEAEDEEDGVSQGDDEGELFDEAQSEYADDRIEYEEEEEVEDEDLSDYSNGSDSKLYKTGTALDRLNVEPPTAALLPEQLSIPAHRLHFMKATLFPSNRRSGNTKEFLEHIQRLRRTRDLRHAVEIYNTYVNEGGPSTIPELARFRAQILRDLRTELEKPATVGPAKFVPASSPIWGPTVPETPQALAFVPVDNPAPALYPHQQDPTPSQIPSSLPTKSIYESSLRQVSLLSDRDKCPLDVALIMGRSFRAGWAPNGLLALSSGGVVQIPVEHFERTKRPQDLPLGSLNLQTVQATPRHTAKLVAQGQLVEVELEKELVLRMLQTMREHSDLEPDKINGQAVPKFVLTQENASKLLEAYVSLMEGFLQAEIVEDDDELARLRLEHHAKVWCLVYALWGVISDQDPAYLLVETETPHSKNLERRLALDQWLQIAVRPFVDRDLEALDDEAQREGVSNDLQRIFILLTGKRIEEAVNLAIQLRDFRLATLIAQAHSSARFASQSWPGDLDDQLHLWTEKQMSQAGSFDQTRLKIYRLLAGRVKDVAEDLEWFRVLALFAWYGSAPDADLTSVIANYATAFPASTPDRIARPTPYYQLHKETTSSSSPRGPASPPYDMCFELLRQYYSRRLLEISHLLNPLNSSPFPLDFQLSWHLLTLLVALKPLDIPSASLTANLTESYCAQLESLGLWEWAIFVLLHSGLEPAARERRVKELLGRNISARGPVPNEQLLQAILAQSGWGRDRPRELELNFTCDGPDGRVLETARVTLREGGLSYQVMHSLDDPRLVRGKFHSLSGWLRAMQPGLSTDWYEDSRYLTVRLSTETDPQSYCDFIASHPTNSDPYVVEEAIGFGIPREWIEEALGYASLRLTYTRHTSTQLDSAPSVRAVLWLEQPLRHFLCAGAWATAYDILVNRDLACALLLSERLPDLHYYFSCLAPHEATLPGWPSGGKLFYDYAAVRLAVGTLTTDPDELVVLLEKLSSLSQTLESWGTDPVRRISNCAQCGETISGLAIFTGTHPNSPQLHSTCASCVDCGRPSAQYASGRGYYCSECARRAEKQARAKGAKAVESLHLQPLDLRYKPQPRLSNIALSELAYWVASLPRVLQSATDVETSIAKPPQLLIPPSFRQFELDTLLSDYLTQNAL